MTEGDFHRHYDAPGDGRQHDDNMPDRWNDSLIDGSLTDGWNSSPGPHRDH